jgi:hypothetical protein
MSDTNESVIIDALMNAMSLRKRGKVDERSASAKAASEQMAQRMPGAVMPHEALQKQKQREAMLDAMARQQ